MLLQQSRSLFCFLTKMSIGEEHNSYIFNDINKLRSLAQSILERPKKNPGAQGSEVMCSVEKQCHIPLVLNL